MFCLYNWLLDIEVLYCIFINIKKIIFIYRLWDVIGIEDCLCEEVVFLREDDDEEEVDKEEVEIGSLICRVLCFDDFD